VQSNAGTKWKNKGKQRTSHLTVNGMLEVRRTIYWNKQRGTQAPMDAWLGILRHRYSAGVREMACRMSLDSAFVPATENLRRMSQLTISDEALRELVQREGQHACGDISQCRYGPDWTSLECIDQTLITGADGVMVPMVTQQQKQKRRDTQAKRRKGSERASAAQVGRPRSGSDGLYKEFKIVSFYDSDKSHMYAVGTAGDHAALGRLMRRQAGKLKIDQARHKYSVTDGADWIARQYATQLPMLEENILDYYHLKEHVTLAAQALYGEGTARARAWREEMMGHVWNQGSLVMLDHLANYIRCYRSGPKAEALRSLRQYITKRVNMTDYPSYRLLGYDCGSGPTESFCGTLTKRLKGRGMHWDKDNAQSMMALGSLYYSRLWNNYWQLQRAA
jgi:hypothetical protein